MSHGTELLTDEQWAKIEDLLPKEEMPRKRGRPRADDRRVIEGILKVLRTGARWKDLARSGCEPRHLLTKTQTMGRRGNLAEDLANLPFPT